MDYSYSGQCSARHRETRTADVALHDFAPNQHRPVGMDESTTRPKGRIRALGQLSGHQNILGNTRSKQELDHHHAANEDTKAKAPEALASCSDSAGIRTRVRRRMLVASAYDTPTLLNRVMGKVSLKSWDG
jgi:hypothetical protein